MRFHKKVLYNAVIRNPNGLRRLARWLGLKGTDEMSLQQVARLVYWRITRTEVHRRQRLFPPHEDH